MSDDNFKSGDWTGWYVYSGKPNRHRMDLHLDFKGGMLSGSGTDDIGQFSIRGRYDPKNKEVWWTKYEAAWGLRQGQISFISN